MQGGRGRTLQTDDVRAQVFEGFVVGAFEG